MRTILSRKPFTLADFDVWDKDAAIPQEYDGESTNVPGHGPVVECTNSARYIADKIGRDRAVMVGFLCEDNPKAGVCNVAGGHDWVIVDDRFYIDWWAKFIESETKRVAFDKEDPKDAEFIAEFYGDPDKWEYDMKTVTSIQGNRLPPQLRLGVAASFRKLRAMADSDHAKEGETLGAFIAKLKAFKAEDDGSDAKTAKEFAEMLDIQASNGNWDANAYMHGMLNGMVLMAWVWALNYGIVEQEDGDDCPYLSAPAAGFKDKDEE